MSITLHHVHTRLNRADSDLKLRHENRLTLGSKHLPRLDAANPCSDLESWRSAKRWEVVILGKRKKHSGEKQKALTVRDWIRISLAVVKAFTLLLSHIGEG